MVIEIDGEIVDKGRVIKADGVVFTVYDTGQHWPKTNRRIYSIWDATPDDEQNWHVIASSFEEMLDEICERLGDVEYIDQE